MRKWISLTGVFTALLSALSFAAPRPVASLSLGSDRANVFSTKSITLLPPFQNTYIGINRYDTEAVIGLFLGAKRFSPQNWAWQLGLSYFQSSSFVENGNVYQFSDPAFNNLTYQYQIQSRRVSVETKLAHAFRQIFRPYVSAGVGEAFNRAYAYMETPVSSGDVPMAQAFGSHMTHSLTYSVGLGMDVDIGEHVRIGAGYRFINLGNASLGVTPLQSGANTISNSRLYTNEFLAQFTYVG